MNVFDFALMSIEGLWERKFRFSLNLVGILIGCAAVTGLIAMTEGMRNNIYDDLEVFGATTIQVYPTASTGEGGQIWIKLDWRDLNLIRKIQGVEVASPLLGGRYVKYSVRGETYIKQVVGIDEDYFKIHVADDELQDGRAITRSDFVACMIGGNIAQPDEEKEPVLGVGDRIKMICNVQGEDKEMTLHVVGVIQKQGFGNSIDDYIIINIRACEQFFETGGLYDAIDVKVRSTDDVDDVAYNIKDKLDNVGVFTAEMALNQVNQVLGTINAVLGGIAGISLLVAGVGIINTMTVSVLERTREIGTMKAIGAKRVDVLMIFMAEAVVTGVVGGTFGAGFGFLLSHFVSGYVGIKSAPTLQLGMMIVGFAVVTCVLSGLYPAWRASNLHPVEALRQE